jgi:cytochrome c551/c552
MAGPVYYTDLFPKETRLPDYYDGKLIIYEWIRGWIKAVTLLPNGDFDKMEPFFPGIKLNSLIDMEVGPDGKLYLLEYGSGWFTKNPDAGLARIDYNAGNMPPKLTALKVNKTSGVLPLAIKASTEATDAEKDNMKFTWDLGDGTTKETATPELEYTYTKPGDYTISVEAKDAKGGTTKSDAISIYAGNEVPEVAIQLTGGNKSMYLPGYPLRYSVTVNDKSDTSKTDPTRLFISVDYVEGFDKAGASMGHQQGQAAINGKSLTLSLDCKSCHKENEKSVGPSYTSVAKKYKDDPKAMSYLTQKIIGGGSGVWGEVAMPAHPTLLQNDVQQVVTWITSLANSTVVKKSLPPSGTITPPDSQKPKTVMVLSASYTDLGGNNIKALTGTNQLTMPGNSVGFSGKEEVKGFNPFTYNGNRILILPSAEGWFALANTDLTGVKSVNIVAGWQNAPETSIDFEVRLDAPDGKLLGKGSIPKAEKNQRIGIARVALEPANDDQLHKLYFIYKPKKGAPVTAAISTVQFNSH